MVGVGGYFGLSLIFKYWYLYLYCICNARLQEVIKVPVLSCIIPACLKSRTEVKTLKLLHFVKRKHVLKRQKCLLKHLVCCTCILGEYSITCYLALSAISYLHKTSVDILPQKSTRPLLQYRDIRYYFKSHFFKAWDTYSNILKKEVAANLLFNRVIINCVFLGFLFIFFFVTKRHLLKNRHSLLWPRRPLF